MGWSTHYALYCAYFLNHRFAPLLLLAYSGYDVTHLLATATVGLSMCTALLGVGLFVIGKLKLASYVQYLPTPVVGGYLAFIGFFCGQSGLALMAGVEISGLKDWPLLYTSQVSSRFYS